MEFRCSVCGYTSPQKKDVVRHINRIRSCGTGTKQLVEVPVEIKCSKCNKMFSTKAHLKYHIQNNCKFRDESKDAKIKELEDKVKELQKIANVSTINNNDNRTMNDNRTYNIFVLNNYEDTKLDKLTDKAYRNLLNDSEAHQIIPRLIKQIHFNPDIPENHNVYISNRNKNNKHLNIFRDGHWEVENKSTEIENIISDKESNLSDWIGEKGKKYPEALEKFNEYLDQKYDEDTAKLMKEEVELVLYNNRHMIKKQ